MTAGKSIYSSSRQPNLKSRWKACSPTEGLRCCSTIWQALCMDYTDALRVKSSVHNRTLPVEITLLLVPTGSSSGDFGLNSLLIGALPIAAEWERTPISSIFCSAACFWYPFLPLFPAEFFFFLFHSFWCCCFLVLIKGEEGWCNSTSLTHWNAAVSFCSWIDKRAF